MMVLFIVTGVLLYGWWIRYRIRTFIRLVSGDPILIAVRGNGPLIVYFSDPTRWLCQTRQHPALEQLRHDLSDPIQIIEIDVRQDPAAAERWGVITTPITFILDETLQTCHVNDGVATTETLKMQIAHLS
jgi:hypothetical protein